MNSDYTIAVVAKWGEEFKRYVTDISNKIQFRGSEAFIGNWRYIHVPRPDSLRGHKINGIAVVGEWKDPNFQDADYRMIMRSIEVCMFRE
jgi:hypothetical protein